MVVVIAEATFMMCRDMKTTPLHLRLTTSGLGNAKRRWMTCDVSMEIVTRKKR